MTNKSSMMSMCFIALFLGVMIFMPELAHAQFSGGFESKMQNLTTRLITVVMPLLSVLGLVYAVFLAMTGDGAAKGRIIAVLACSIVGFMAPQIIGWLQSAAGY